MWSEGRCSSTNRGEQTVELIVVHYNCITNGPWSGRTSKIDFLGVPSVANHYRSGGVADIV